MAEYTTMSSGRLVCPFYSYSSCRDGNLCLYDHSGTRNELTKSICRYFLIGNCRYGDNCWFSHAIIDNNANSASVPANDDEQPVGHSQPEIPMNPLDENQRSIQLGACGQEQKMESDRDLDKTCGICLDVIMEKGRFSEHQYGILEKCNHVFCFSCIKQWRNARNGTSGGSLGRSNLVVAITCPECRTFSDFCIPSKKWVDSEAEKKKLVDDFKMSLRIGQSFPDGTSISGFFVGQFHVRYASYIPDGGSYPDIFAGSM